MVYRGGRKANNMRNIIEWHKERFPRATPLSQKMHLLQEVKEFEDSDLEHAIEELADIYIVANSLKRWKSYVKFANEVLHYYYDDFDGTTKIKIDNAVESKIKVVNERDYFWNGTDYDRIRDE